MPDAPPASSRPTVVADINVLVSSLISRRDIPSSPARILSAWRRDEIILALSTPMLAKVGEVLQRLALLPFLTARFSSEGVESEIQNFLRSLRHHAQITPGTFDIQVIEADPEDDTILIAAVESNAACIISGDKHLKDLGSYEGIPILSPAEFVAQYEIA